MSNRGDPVRVLVELVVLIAWSMACRGEGEPSARPFPVRGYHQHIYPDVQPMRVFHRRLETLKRSGYNLVVFGMGTPSKSTITMHADGSITPQGCTTAALRELVRHAVDLGLEPVFEMKFIGKQLPLLREVIAVHPELVIDPRNRATVLNAAFRFQDGRDAYSATSLALVDYLLALYPAGHPAKYFFFGIDEFSSEDMARLAKRLGMTAPQAFAHCLNLGTDHVLAKGITPLLWGDMMLSPALGTAAHGLTIPGYRPDPRLTTMPGGAYHSVFESARDAGLHRVVNSLRDRGKMIVVDWHYSPSPSGEFPSMDYFQHVGFKDVWGAPWHNATNIRQFARYAARRGAGGMIATAWHDAYRPEARLLLHFIISSSAAYFRNPDLDPPAAQPAGFSIRGDDPRSRENERRAGFVLRTDRHVRFRAPVPEPITPTDGRLLLTSASRRGELLETSLAVETNPTALTGSLTLPETSQLQQYQVRYCYTDAATGYTYLKEDTQGFMVGDTPPHPPEVEDSSILLLGDFSHLSPKVPAGSVWLGGACAGPLGWATSQPEQRSGPRPGGLDTQWYDRVWFLPSGYLNHALCSGMHIHLEARLTGRIAGNPYCALFTKGGFHTGFRVLVGEDRHVLFQLAGLDSETGGPLWVRTRAHAVPENRWFTLDLRYVPPAAAKPGRAEIFLDGRRVAVRPVHEPMAVSAAVIGLGCEFRTPTAGPFGKRRPNFPGLIRKVVVRTPTTRERAGESASPAGG